MCLYIFEALAEVLPHFGYVTRNKINYKEKEKKKTVPLAYFCCDSNNSASGHGK